MMMGVRGYVVLPKGIYEIAVWAVNDCGSADFTSIQAAVAAANEEDSIEVWDRSYI